MVFYMSSLNYVEICENFNGLDNTLFSELESLKTVVITNPSAYIDPRLLEIKHQVIIYIKGEPNNPEIETLKNTLGLNHWYIIDPFKLVMHDGIKYILFSKHVGRIVSYDESEIPSDVIIPDYIEGIPITDYQHYFMRGSLKLRSFRFPKTLKRIRTHAFKDCPNLEEVIFSTPLDEKEMKRAVSNEGVILRSSLEEKYKEYAILIERISQNKESEYIIKIFLADSYKEAMLLGLDYVIEHYSIEVEYMMIDDQPQKLIDLNKKNNLYDDIYSLSNNRKILQEILMQSKEGITYIAEVFGKDNAIDFKEVTILDNKSFNNEETRESYHIYVNYLIEACHTLYKVIDPIKKIVWSIET